MGLNRVTLIGQMGTEAVGKVIGEGAEAKPLSSFRFVVHSPFEDQATWLTIACWEPG